jgi:hypothetical protein
MLRRLKQQLTKLPYPLFLRLYLLKRRLVEDRQYVRARKRSHIPLLEEIDLAQYKRSDTIFLLGSGPSINQIPPERWQVIARHDSIGFNFWLFHPFVPTLYSYESIDATEWAPLYEAFVKSAARRAADYRSVPKIVAELNAKRSPIVNELPPVWRENLFTYYPVTPAARTEEEFSYALAYLKEKNVFAPRMRIRRLFKYASTLSSLVALAVQMQYSRIVLCGVDLKSQEYFYQDPKLYPESADLVPEPREIPHLTVRDFPWLVKQDDVLRQMRKQVLEPAGIELYVEHRSSRLWPEVPEAPAEVFATSNHLGASAAR